MPGKLIHADNFRGQSSVLSDLRTRCLQISILRTNGKKATDPQFTRSCFGRLKTDTSALNEMVSESHFVGGDVAAVFVPAENLEKL